MGLGSMDRLDPIALADHLAIPILPLSLFRDEWPDAVRHFSRVESGAFSAVTVFDGTRRFVIYNDVHRSERQSNDIVHELSHGLLGHTPHAGVDGNTGCRIWHDDIEAEADFLAGALLVPDWAAVQIVRRQMSRATAAETFGVSLRLIEYRINVTGARTRAARIQP
ncbi:MAG TPA: ImmA/IrrE family metallo-endopeptidase [Vicinamibacterales bacterium]|nr:ImmA/IrrE family metallo-endopeptidase [Vicinamibacterales bacterium]